MAVLDGRRQRQRAAGPLVLDGLLGKALVAVESAVGRRSDDSDRPDGAGRSGRSAGHGIAGMRERVALHGGTLEAGPLPGGGFRAAATLPVEEPLR